MTTQYTLPYDPVSLLSANTRIKLSGEDSEITLYKGGGNRELTVLSGGYNGSEKVEYEIETTDETLYYLKDGVPTAFDMFSRGYLKDGVGRNKGGIFETLAISYRDEISSFPLVLGTYIFSLFPDYDSNYHRSGYNPYVQSFKSRKSSSALKKDTMHFIDEENNDYWESVFEYDINQDGFIPEYRTFELYTRPTKDEVNGKVIEGKKKDDVLEGGKLDDHIDGKKGNDIVYGKKGNDALFGSKGRDQLYGSQGDDYLSGGSDVDILEGGSGADIFALSSGNDQITDFSLEDGDKIAIKGQDVGNFTVTSTDFGSLISVEGYGSLEVDISLEGIDLVDYVFQSVD
jgi:Ca2+-binding RTX toxin-like protein